MDEDTALAERADQSRELVVVPAVVLVGQRDIVGGGRDEPQGPLEVEVEARTNVGASEVKSLVIAHEPLHLSPFLLG